LPAEFNREATVVFDLKGAEFCHSPQAMIGERLEEARKRKGVSIREAAEATKIRGDYLLAMEDNSFDIPLPQIYVRGFLKNYARYVNLDSTRILTDYDAHLLGRSHRASGGAHEHADRESLGHVEIKQAGAEADHPVTGGDQVVVTEAPEDDQPEPELRFNLDRDRQAGDEGPPPPTLDREATRHDQEIWNENKTLYMKIGVVFAGILLVAIILIVLIQVIGGRESTPEINPELAAPSEAAQPERGAPAEPTRDTLILTASDNVTLIVEQTLDRQRLYSGSLNAGETLSLDKEGPVSIRFTNGSALTFEKDGRQFRPGQAGVGRTVVE
jgi:cytoskeletal protein RodZ